MLIMREAFLGADKFETFMERLPISRAALTSRLTMLTAAGLLERRPPEAKRAVYRLTAAGDDLKPVYLEIGRWSAKHLFTNAAPTEWGQS